MKLSRHLAALLLLVIVTGCSSDTANKAKPAQLVNFKATAQLDVRWKKSVGKAGVNVLTPAVTSGSVIASNGKNEIQCFDLASGKLRWSFNNGFVISGGIGAGNDEVVVGGDKGDVVAFDELTGKLRWRSKVSSEVLSAPQIADGIVVVRSGDGRIAGLNAQDGKQVWLYERATPALVARNNASVTIRHGIVYAGFAAGKLSAIGLHNGVIVWESSVSQPHGNTELERISDIISLPIVDDSQVCAVAFQGRLGCFDAEQGGALWSRDVSSDKGLTMSRKYLFMTDTGDNVLGLDKLSGSSYWKNDQLALRQVTAPLAMENCLVVADFEGYLHALNRDDGRFMARINTDGSPVHSTPVAAGADFVVQTSGGGLYVIAIH